MFAQVFYHQPQRILRNGDIARRLCTTCQPASLPDLIEGLIDGLRRATLRTKLWRWLKLVQLVTAMEAMEAHGADQVSHPPWARTARSAVPASSTLAETKKASVARRT